MRNKQDRRARRAFRGALHPPTSSSTGACRARFARALSSANEARVRILCTVFAIMGDFVYESGVFAKTSPF